jgi:RloB-like protein
MRHKIAVVAALAVGEGKAEVLFLSHIKALYLPRGCGTTLKIAGGLGKGGKGVLDYAISISANAEYDKRILLLDTDTDWNNAERARAKENRFDVVESTPCFEAWLLAVHGEQRTLNSDECKRAFEKRFAMKAHDERVYETHFSKHLLDEKRLHVTALNNLLRLLGV